MTLALAAVAAMVGCGGGADSSTSSTSGNSSEGSQLDIVGYSTPGALYEEVFEPEIVKTPFAEGVSFSNSFGASGDQSRAVAAGQPASIVHFSNAGDVERLVEKGIVSKDWNKQPFNGMVQYSVVAISFRKGNPKGIKTLDDVLEKDVEVITPNPFSSGAGRWNIMAVYGTLINEGRSRQEALAGVKTLLEKTVSQPDSASDASSAFTGGEGDVLLGYESEAIMAEKAGEDLEYVVPPSTIWIETPIAVTKDAPEPEAKSFLTFIWSGAMQAIWAENGYRPLYTRLRDPKEFPVPKDLFRISQFGGWKKVDDEFFAEGTGSVTKIEEELGVSTSD